MFDKTLLKLSVGPILYLVFTTSLSNLGIVRSTLPFTLSNLGFVRSNLLFMLSNFGLVRSDSFFDLARSLTVPKSNLRTDEKAEA
jgi:hypothetical protein